MKVVDACGSRLTVRRGIFRKQVAEIEQGASEYSVDCGWCGGEHTTKWVFVITGAPISAPVYHCIKEYQAWLVAEAKRADEQKIWQSVQQLPAARKVK